MSITLRCIVAVLLVAVAVSVTMGTLQQVRFERCLATQSILREGTTRPDQLTEHFTQRFLFARDLDLYGDLTAAQRDRFWLGNPSALGTSLLGWPVEWGTLIGGLACAFALFPVLVAATKPGFRRAFALSDRAARRSAFSMVMWQTTRQMSWIVICCTPLAWWLISDRYARPTTFQQWPRVHFGAVSVTGLWLFVAIAGYWSIGLAHIFARRAAFQWSREFGLCADCGYNCTGLPRCPECGLTVGERASAGHSKFKDGQTVVRLAIAFSLGVGVLAMLLARPDLTGVKWFFFQPSHPVPSLIYARPSEVLEIRCGDETFLVAWRMEFLPSVGNRAVPDSVVSATGKRAPESDSSSKVRIVSSAPSSAFGTLWIYSYQLNIPSGRARLQSTIGAWDERRSGKFVDNMVMFEFSGVSEVRRWDPQSDDPDIRKVVAALESVAPGAGQRDAMDEGSRKSE